MHNEEMVKYMMYIKKLKWFLNKASDTSQNVANSFWLYGSFKSFKIKIRVWGEKWC